MFGALNTFFSGLGFIGLLVTIILQIYFHQKEMYLERHKMELDKIKENEANTTSIKNKLIYIVAIFNRIFSSNLVMINELQEWINKNPTDQLQLYGFSYSTIEDTHELVSKRLNQEEYYTSYKQIRNDNFVLDAFGFVDDILALRKQLKLEFDIMSSSHSVEFSKLSDLFEKLDNLGLKNTWISAEIKNININQCTTLDQIIDSVNKLKLSFNAIYGGKDLSTLDPLFWEYINTLIKITSLSKNLNIILNSNKVRISNGHKSLIDKNNKFIGIVRRIEIILEPLENR